MYKHEQKYCPSCNQEFECKVGDVSRCQCNTVEISIEHSNFFNAKYDDCLCANCMKALRTEYNVMQHKKKLEKLLGNNYK